MPRQAVDARLTNLLSLLTGVLLLVAAVTNALYDNGSLRWVWLAIGVAAVFIIVMSLVRRRNLVKEAAPIPPHP